MREGLQMLEHAGLICLVLSPTFGGDFHATRVGEQALAEGDVR